MNIDIGLIDSQKALLLNQVKMVLKSGQDYALLDFPDHSNVGDSAIWLGEVKLLLEASMRIPRYVCKYNNFDEDELRRLSPSGPIFLHGGGNMGDLWPQHQVFREEIIKKFHDREIIQLPQTVFFQDSRKAEEFSRILRLHGNVRIWVRDRKSFEYTRSKIQSDAVMVPDGAFGIGPLECSARVKCAVFALLREDQEKSFSDRSLLNTIQGLVVGDWLDEPREFAVTSKLKGLVKAIGSGKFRREQIRYLEYCELARGRLNRGVQLLGAGGLVITDRLHGHIISLLMGVPHIVLDNSYGKVHGYINTWTHGANSCEKAFSIYDVVDRVLRSDL